MFDFYSDTTTRPTRPMLEAILEAEFGDEQKGEDPTNQRPLRPGRGACWCKEAAVLLPSGTMCNEVALRVHCSPGDEVIAQGLSHIINYEAGGPAALSGVMNPRRRRPPRALLGGRRAGGRTGEEPLPP